MTSEHLTFQSNDEALFAGFDLVKQLFSRYARIQTNMSPDPEDGFLNTHLDTWLELLSESCKKGIRIPILDLVNDGMTQHELYMILILLGIHFETGLKEACAALRGHAMLQAPSPSLLLDLLFPSGIQKVQLYKTGQLPVILEDKRYVILRHDAASAFAEPSVYLSPKCLQKLLNLPTLPDTAKVYDGKFYHLETPNENFCIFDPIQKAEIVQVCRQYLISEITAPLCFLAYGRAGTGKHTFAQDLAYQLKRPLCKLHVAQLLSQTGDARHIALIFREIEQLKAILLIPSIHEVLHAPVVIRLAVLEALKNYHGIGIMTALSHREIDQEFMAIVVKTIEFTGMTLSERQMFWQILLRTVPNAIESSEIEKIATQYLFTGGQIQHAFLVSKLLASSTRQQVLKYKTIEQACHFVLQKTFDGLTVFTHSEGAKLDRLVLPEKQHQTFVSILSAAQNRDKVMIEWGFGQRLVTGRGLCILFDGPPGTGKTFAAEVLANELHRPLERVHLPNLVSKWVGETGENLAKLFAAATASNAILLLDEADALLSKRVSGANKSSDRYANMEINILLQELERFNGISILTTNLEKSLDEALERRVQYRITFVKPEAQEREQLWRTLMSPQAPLEGDINYVGLAESFELAGGHIKNAILNAAYHACSQNRGIRYQDLRDAATAECAKQGLLIQS